MIGRKFGKWTVLEKSHRLNLSRQRYYICKCECGTITEVLGVSLNRNKSKSCQKCCVSDVNIIIGSKYNRWLVLSISMKKTKANHIFFACRCDCGKLQDVRSDQLRKNLSTGCFKCAHSEKQLPCRICYCINHKEIDLEISECDLLGFCSRCDKFDLKSFLKQTS